MLCWKKWFIAFAFTAVLVAVSSGGAAVAIGGDATGEEAEKLFRAMEEKLAKVKTLECSVEILCDFGGQMEALSYKGSLLLGEGNRARQEIYEPGKAPPIRLLMVSDGTRVSMQDNGMSHPAIENTPKDLNRDILTWLARTGVFVPHLPLPDVNADNAEVRFPVANFKLGDKEKIGERATQRLDYQLSIKGQDPTFSVTVWLDTATGLPLQRKLFSQVGKEQFTVVETYSKLTLDGKVDAMAFDLSSKSDGKKN
jgi:outer membrane lipoprotein-sorting protein